MSMFSKKPKPKSEKTQEPQKSRLPRLDESGVIDEMDSLTFDYNHKKRRHAGDAVDSNIV